MSQKTLVGVMCLLSACGLLIAAGVVGSRPIRPPLIVAGLLDLVVAVVFLFARRR